MTDCKHPQKPDIWTLNQLREYTCPDCGKTLKVQVRRSDDD